MCASRQPPFTGVRSWPGAAIPLARRRGLLGRRNGGSFLPLPMECVDGRAQPDAAACPPAVPRPGGPRDLRVAERQRLPDSQREATGKRRTVTVRPPCHQVLLRHETTQRLQGPQDRPAARGVRRCSDSLPHGRRTSNSCSATASAACTANSTTSPKWCDFCALIGVKSARRNERR